jgi:FixJ family two-component response regulator
MIQESQMSEIIHVIDDDPLVCTGICSLVESMGLKVLAFESAESFLQSVPVAAQGCVIADVRLKGMNGLALQQQLTNLGYQLPVIVVTAYASTPLTVKAMQNGAVNLLEKPFDEQALWDSIMVALKKGRVLREEQEQRTALNARLAHLSDAEREVLHHVMNGASNKAIAATLNVSLRTVESRRASILKKVAVDSMAEVIRLVTLSELPAKAS